MRSALGREVRRLKSFVSARLPLTWSVFVPWSAKAYDIRVLLYAYLCVCLFAMCVSCAKVCNPLGGDRLPCGYRQSICPARRCSVFRCECASWLGVGRDWLRLMTYHTYPTRIASAIIYNCPVDDDASVCDACAIQLNAACESKCLAEVVGKVVSTWVRCVSGDNDAVLSAQTIDGGVLSAKPCGVGRSWIKKPFIICVNFIKFLLHRMLCGSWARRQWWCEYTHSFKFRWYLSA